MTANGTTRTAAIAGFLIAGAAVLLLGFLFGRRDDATSDLVPPLRILQPVTGSTARNPVRLRFTTPAGLRLTRNGWAAGDLHLHLMVDGRELMPAAADITAADTTFTWRLPPLPPGTHRIHLTWAGRHHGNLAGRTDTISVEIDR